MNNNYSSSNSILMGTNLPAITLSSAIECLTIEAVKAYSKFELCRNFSLDYNMNQFVRCEQKIREVLNIASSKRVMKTFTEKLLAAMSFACNYKKEILELRSNNTTIKEISRIYNIHPKIVRFWEKH